MVNWSCSSTLCFNNYKSKDKDGNPISYYRLPRLEKLQQQYSKILKTEGMNWKDGHICSAHWSRGFRENTFDLPDVPVPEEQLNKLKQKFDNAKKLFDSATKPSSKMRATLSKNKRKYNVALQLSNAQPVKTRREIKKENDSFSTSTVTFITDSSGSAPEPEVNVNTDELHTEISILREQNNKLSSEKSELEAEIVRLKVANTNLRRNEFSYSNVSVNPQKFHKLCGVDKEQFDILFECVQPYTHLIPSGLSNVGERSIDLQTTFDV